MESFTLTPVVLCFAMGFRVHGQGLGPGEMLSGVGGGVGENAERGGIHRHIHMDGNTWLHDVGKLGLT